MDNERLITLLEEKIESVRSELGRVVEYVAESEKQLKSWKTRSMNLHAHLSKLKDELAELKEPNVSNEA